MGNRLPQEHVGSREFVRYDPELALEVCKLIAEGQTLVEALKSSKDFPSRASFYRWTVNNSELAAAFKTARELSAYSFEDEALDMARIIRMSPETGVKVQAYKVAMDQLRWSAARRNPGVYGDRALVNVTVPITINTPLDMSSDTMPAAVQSENIYKIEATVPVPLEVTAPDPEENVQIVKKRPGGHPTGPVKQVLKPRMGAKEWADKQAKRRAK